MSESSQNKKDLTRRELLTLGGAATLALGAASLPGEARAGEAPLPQVPRRKLGKTGETIPILLVGGAAPLDRNFDPKLAEALRFGVNYFDVADCYNGGNAETAVGNFHTRAKARDKIWITSKSDRHDPEGLAQVLDTSLAKLRTPRVDMYFLHGLKEAKFLSADLGRTVERLKHEGKTRFFGFSCHDGNVTELLTQAAGLSYIDAVMFRYNFRQYGNAELNQAMDACAKAGVGLIAMKTQGSEAGIRDAWQRFEKTGKWNKHQAVLKAVWADARISAAVSHMDNFDKLRENIAAALDKTSLGAAEIQALDRYAAATRSLSCDGCDHHCTPALRDQPAAAGVRIGDTMRCLMYHDAYGELDRARATFARLPAAAQRLTGIDFAPAAAACPHGVDLVAHMARAARLFNA